MLLSLPPLCKRVRNRVESCIPPPFFSFKQEFLRSPNEGLTLPRKYNDSFMMLKLNGGEKSEKHASDTESSKRCQRSRGCIQLALQLARHTAPHAPHRLPFQKNLKYPNILK